jgi:hypothetical protein
MSNCFYYGSNMIYELCKISNTIDQMTYRLNNGSHNIKYHNVGVMVSVLASCEIVRVITVFTIFRLLTDFVCLYTYEFWLSLCKIARSSVVLLLPLFHKSHDISYSWKIPELALNNNHSLNIREGKVTFQYIKCMAKSFLIFTPLQRNPMF